MSEEAKWKELAKQISDLITNENKEKKEDQTKEESISTLKNLLQSETAADIALALEELDPKDSPFVFEALDRSTTTEVLSKLEPERTNKILELHPEKLLALIKSLPPREAAALMTDIPSKLNKHLKEIMTDSKTEKEAEERLCYPKGSIGRLMTTQFVLMHKGISVEEGINKIKSTDPEVEIPDDIYIVEKKTGASGYFLCGAVSIRVLLMSNPENKIDTVMSTDVVTVDAAVNETDAAALLSKYKFKSLPVINKEGYLVGVVPADDLFSVIVNRLRKLYVRAVGTDAEKMEKLSPMQAAKLRVPWLLGTMLIELVAGMIISHFDSILQKIILLTSFMPVISAISGNVGLQAAAITVRALDEKTTSKKNVWTSLRKESATTVIMAIVCGVVLGAIGAIWAKHVPFGILIGVALTCSMLTAAIMGTVIPSVSKKFGFDPATTAGPFETAFQDIIGFAVFLGLATMLQHWMM